MGVGAANADVIFNNIDGTVDAVAEIMALNVGGPAGATTVALAAANDDGKQGCNLTGQTELKLAVNTDNPLVAVVSPSTVTFTSCGFAQKLSVSPLAAGSARITLSEISNDTDGTFDLAPASFTVNVSAPAPANTAPKVSVSGVDLAAKYPKGSVPEATCDVTDAEDGPSSFPATLSDVSGPYATDGIGEQTASCSYTDRGGLEASSSVTYSIVDGSAPVISYDLNPAAPDGDNGWYRSDVALTWHVTEPESPNSLSKAGCVDQNITTDQVATAYACSATSAGGPAAGQSVTIKRDATAPTVSYASAPEPDGQNGWYVSPVTATFAVSDATSGVPSSTATASSDTGEEGAAVVVPSPAVSDLAGNITLAGTASHAFKIDLTAPTATLDAPFAASYYYGEVPGTPTCTAHDAVAGAAGCEISGYSTTVGRHTLVATATDNAGRSGTTELATYTVKAWAISAFYQPADMGGVWNTVKGGSTVPLKFEVFAGSRELTDPAVVDKFVVNKVSCSTTTASEDAVELVTTGATNLRYDPTAGQFIQNWQTPKAPGACYSVTVTTDDGSTSKPAIFKLK
ncbi:hypothetical protein GCM10027039_29050 [Terrabacter koreensis]